ncbi:hypothetical protein [Streptomyces sp. CC228A]|uniref:hypothetical protein n=1 Tax=Streptomyces sp. CC228A TaxID=2898186 RepID=UPI001F37FE4A|nr:hypothetical protein [Streptomyces sp. CC228A]
MSRFPEGKFTIVNNETGRAVRVRLGRTHDVSDHRLGTRYLQTVSEKPWLELGQADNSPATVWRHNSQQIVSHAVGEYQNIGDYCVWMDSKSTDQMKDRFNTQRAFESRLNDMPADLRGRLAPLIPAEWTAIQARLRAGMAKNYEFQQDERARAYAEAEAEAWAAEENPPSAHDLSLLRAYRLRSMGGRPDPISERGHQFAEMPEEVREKVLSFLPAEEQQALRSEIAQLRGEIDQPTKEVVERLRSDPRAEQVRERAEKLLPEVKERRAAAAQAAIPLEDLNEWHRKCAVRRLDDSEVLLRFTNFNYSTDEDKRIMAALDTYLKAAAKEGIVPPVIASDSTTRLYGCGASQGPDSTYGWTYDGTHIYASDSNTIPSRQTYWTDAGGYLVGRPKGGPGQTWSIVKWTPTEPEPGTNLSETALTGLFGPLDAFGTGVFGTGGI